jgi:hypothetical protein
MQTNEATILSAETIMAIFKIQIPPHGVPCTELDKLSFTREQEAVEALIQMFHHKKIDFKIKQTRDRKAFINTQKGELASVVSLDA